MTDDTIETTTTSTLPPMFPATPPAEPLPDPWSPTPAAPVAAFETPTETYRPYRGYDPLTLRSTPQPDGNLDGQPDLPPQESVAGKPDGEQRRGSTGQLWSVKSGRWERIRENTAGEPDDKVSDASADDSRKRLAEHRLFRNGIRSYRIPQWDQGHISRGVKYAYITEAMIEHPMPPLPGDGSASGVAVATGIHAATSNKQALSAAILAGTAQPMKADNSFFGPDEAVRNPEAGAVSEAVMLLNDAKVALAANSLSNVGYYIGRAIQILEG